MSRNSRAVSRIGCSGVVNEVDSEERGPETSLKHGTVETDDSGWNSESSGPTILEVQGLTMNDDGVEYIPVVEGDSRLGYVPAVEGEFAKGHDLAVESDSSVEGYVPAVEKNYGVGYTPVAENTTMGNASVRAKEMDSSQKEPLAPGVTEDIVTIRHAGEGDGKKDENGKAKDEKMETEAIITLVGKDDVDAASTYSLFMEKDFRYYFQHPYSRLLIAYIVVFCNFLIYAEDPVAHSRKECNIPLIGNCFAFVGTRYPRNAWSLLKVLMWLVGMAIGMVVGKLLVHGLLFNRLFRLKMFSSDQGSWMIMFLVSLVTVFIMSVIYTLFLQAGGDSTLPYRISSLMGVKNDIFMKVAACGTWCGDFFTAWMVTDIMLQEKLYPGWAKPVRTWWKRGWNRIILFWLVTVVTSLVVLFVIATDYIQWDKLNHDFVPSNELGRAFLASFILVMDLLIVIQDWDFPHFMSSIDIKLPGLNTAHIRFNIPKCLRKEHWHVHVTGKWFNYGILFLVMLLDLNMWKNQIFYRPFDYAQFTGPDSKIYTVQDDASLTGNETVISFDYRNNTINPATNQTYLSGDSVMNSRYYYFHLGAKGAAFIPSLVMFILFGVLIWMFGRFKPTTDDPYAGRLKKRVKKRFSFRMPWRRREELNRKIHAVPKLLYFRKRTAASKKSTIETIEAAPGEITETEITSSKPEIKEEPLTVEAECVEVEKEIVQIDKNEDNFEIAD